MDITQAQPGPDLLWYKDSIIYQLHVKSFFDGNGDGIGDFRVFTRNWTTSPRWGLPPSGCCPSSPRRAATMAMTSPTMAMSARLRNDG